MQLKLSHTTFPPVSSCRNWHSLSSHLVSCHGMGGNDFTNIFFQWMFSLNAHHTETHCAFLKHNLTLGHCADDHCVIGKLEVGELLAADVDTFISPIEPSINLFWILRISAIYKNLRIGIFHYVLKAWLLRSLYWKYKMEGIPLFWFNNHQFINQELQKIPY